MLCRCYRPAQVVEAQMLCQGRDFGALVLVIEKEIKKINEPPAKYINEVLLRL